MNQISNPTEVIEGNGIVANIGICFLGLCGFVCGVIALLISLL